MTFSLEGGDVERYIAMASGPFWMVFAGRAICGLSLSLPIYKSENGQYHNENEQYHRDFIWQ